MLSSDAPLVWYPSAHRMGAPQRFGCHPVVSGSGMLQRIFIVDDNPSVRTGIRTLLETSGFEICGEASDGLDAVERAPEINPDLIILDVSMPHERPGRRAQTPRYSPQRPHPAEYLACRRNSRGR